MVKDTLPHFLARSLSTRVRAEVSFLHIFIIAPLWIKANLVLLPITGTA